MVIHDFQNGPVLKVAGQEPSKSTMYGHKGQGVLDKLPIMLEH